MLSEELREARERPETVRSAVAAAARNDAADAASGSAGAMSLHVSKLRGISLEVRNKLKRHGISYTHQLLHDAGRVEGRRRLAVAGRIDERVLTRLVRRADLARIKGIGAIFADMLEMVGVQQVAGLAEQEPAILHRELSRLNAAERLARRAPTPEEVADWVAQARALPHLVEDD